MFFPSQYNPCHKGAYYGISKTYPRRGNIYVIIGGYMATAINDFIQGIIMLGGIVAVIAAVLSSHGGFMGSLIELGTYSDSATVNGEVPGVFASL